jgi:hypothetical protein
MFKSQSSRVWNKFHLKTLNDLDILRLNEAQRNNAIGRLEAGEFKTALARITNVSKSITSRIWNR